MSIVEILIGNHITYCMLILGVLYLIEKYKNHAKKKT